jgi:hypothetical protein
LPSSLSAHPPLSIPALDAFQLQLTPFNSIQATRAKYVALGERLEKTLTEDADARKAAAEAAEAAETSARELEETRESCASLRRRVKRLKSELADAAAKRLRRVLLHTGPHTTASAWCTPILKDFLSRRSFLSAHPSVLSMSSLDAFQIHP